MFSHSLSTKRKLQADSINAQPACALLVSRELRQVINVSRLDSHERYVPQYRAALHRTPVD